MKNLRILAEQFRRAIDDAKAAGEPHDYIRNFPRGQCGHISDIFSQHLLDFGIEPIIYVNGIYYGSGGEDIWSHAWLEVDGKIIDLTADQFKFNDNPLQNDNPVYIGPMNDWYRLFDTEYGSYHEHKGLERSWSNYRELVQCLEIIKKYL